MSILTILWNTAAKCSPTRTLPISSGWSMGFARRGLPVSSWGSLRTGSSREFQPGG